MQKACPALVSWPPYAGLGRRGIMGTSIIVPSNPKGPRAESWPKPEPPSYKITPGSFFWLLDHPYQQHCSDPGKYTFLVPISDSQYPPHKGMVPLGTSEISFACAVLNARTLPRGGPRLGVWAGERQSWKSLLGEGEPTPSTIPQVLSQVTIF